MPFLEAEHRVPIGLAGCRLRRRRPAGAGSPRHHRQNEKECDEVIGRTSVLCGGNPVPAGSAGFAAIATTRPRCGACRNRCIEPRHSLPHRRPGRHPRRSRRPAGSHRLADEVDAATGPGGTASRLSRLAACTTGATSSTGGAQEAAAERAAAAPRPTSTGSASISSTSAGRGPESAAAAAHARLSRLVRPLPRSDPAPDRSGGARRRCGRCLRRRRPQPARIRVLRPADRQQARRRPRSARSGTR